ncbi:DUF4249 domain-containing protein [Maribellus maritimus]|uniref:DUF4249 domain-containing protein n=1 Tax=Maribellus maritimus TaxID=2870838 RepID=UPI001EEA0CFA|nr:DUF4249 domain-containing protein [Maribellus maritimus]MCG6189278.1 DUF4249 domain-containing protein [Maribellus maritimus]
MLLNRKILGAILVLPLLQSCIEPFTPKTVKYDYSIFVEALVTDEAGILPEVRISTTIPLTNSEENSIPEEPGPVNNAEILLLCDDGSEYTYDSPESFASKSIYTLSDSNFRAEPGKSYKIVIHLDGEVLESDYEILRESSPIDSLGYTVKTEKLEEDGETAQGYQFQVNNHNDTPGPSYYRWIPDATYSYTVPYISTYRWNAVIQRLIPYTSDGARECWKNKNINGIYVASTEGLSENSIIGAPLNFESQYGDELAALYSLHVRQFVISGENYKFWNEINKMVYETGGLFERQPYKITGNITCTSNPDLGVTGIFEVAGVSEYREFFATPAEFPVSGTTCDLIEVDVLDYPLSKLPDGVYIIYYEDTNQKMTSFSGCFECNERGGSSVKPAFWEDN